MTLGDPFFGVVWWPGIACWKELGEGAGVVVVRRVSLSIAAAGAVVGSLLLAPPVQAASVSVSTAGRASVSAAHALRTSPAAKPRRAGKGRLRVSVVGVPRGVRALVRVTGPRRFARTVRRTTTLRRLRPGVYRVRAGRVVRRSWTVYPDVSAARIRLGRSPRLRRVTVRFDDVVSNRTKPVKTRQVKAFRPPGPGGTGAVTLAVRARRGQILASGVSRRTPHGMLVRVVKAAGRTAGGHRYVVRQARLTEAIPSGHFKHKVTADLSAAARTTTVRPDRSPGTGTDQASSSGPCSRSAKLALEHSESGSLDLRWALVAGVRRRVCVRGHGTRGVGHAQRGLEVATSGDSWPRTPGICWTAPSEISQVRYSAEDRRSSSSPGLNFFSC